MMHTRRVSPRYWAAELAVLGTLFAAVGVAEAQGQAAEPPDSVATVSGIVRGRFQDGLRVLPDAVVEAATEDGRTQVTAGPDGRYELSFQGRGVVRVRGSHPGYRSVELTVTLPSTGDLTLDLELLAAPLPLSGVEVEAEGSDAIPSPADAEHSTPDPGLEVRMLEISPSIGETGMLDAIQALPGNDPSDPSDVLFMRGSTTELKLVLLDDVPVFTPFHVAGLMRSFEPTVLGSAKLHVGGAPARYDGGLTHILDLRTRSARRDRVRGSASLDLLSASFAAEAPLGSRAGVIFSARSLHDLGQVPLGGERPYGYRDFLISTDIDVADGHSLRTTGFWNAESVRLDFDPQQRSNAEWSNSAASASYRTKLGSADLRFTAGGSRYSATLPLMPSRRVGEPPPETMLATAKSERFRLVGEATWGEAARPVRAGISFEDLAARYEARTLSEDTRAGSAGTSATVGAFVDVTRPLAANVTLRAGLRGDVYSGQRVRMSPRATLFWEFSPEALISVAAGRYHQVTRTPDSELDETLSAFANQVVDPDELLPVATADHVVLSLDQRLGERVSLGVEGFWKRFEGLSGTNGQSVRNSGLDLRVLRGTETGSLWLGYGLSWFWSPVDFSGRSNDFVGRHLLSAGVSGPLGGPFRAEARVAYGAGLPSTSIPFGSSEAIADAAAPPTPSPGLETLSARASDPLAASLEESFFRVDLEVHALFEPAWSGRRWRLRPYLRLLNALNQRDALFYTYQPWRSSEVTPLAERPILPVLGLSISF